MPSLDDAFQLQIDGLVDQAQTVTLADLEASPSCVRVVKTMVCVFGLTGTAIWTGVPLRSLLERAGVLEDGGRPRAKRARFYGYDGFENNLPLEAILEAHAPFEPLIAFHMYDRPLPVEHGFPFRLLLADRYGYKNIKWLKRIELTARDEPTGQYQTRGYSDSAFIEPQVMTEGLRVTEDVPVGPMELCGFAVSGYAAIAAVEVSVDNGEPHLATLTRVDQLLEREPQLADTLQLSPQHGNGTDLAAVWSAFRFVLEVRAGEQRVRIRVRDDDGREADATELRVIGRA